MIAWKEINHAHFRRETKGNAASPVIQLFDARSSILWAKPRGEIVPSLAAHDWKSSRTAIAPG